MPRTITPRKLGGRVRAEAEYSDINISVIWRARNESACWHPGQFIYVILDGPKTCNVPLTQHQITYPYYRR